MTSVAPHAMNQEKPRFRPADTVYTRTFDGELVVLDTKGGEYFALDEIGAELWNGLESGKTLEEIADGIVQRYDVTRDRALADLTALCDELVSRGLFIDERR